MGNWSYNPYEWSCNPIMTEMNDFCLFSWYYFLMDSEMVNHHHRWDNMLFTFFQASKKQIEWSFLNGATDLWSLISKPNDQPH